jgi:hypothetical protein
MGLVLAAAIGAGLAGRIVARACVRSAVLLELLRLRWKIGRWAVRSEAASAPAAAPAVQAASHASARDMLSTAPHEAQGTVLRASCSCGTVTFSLSSPPAIMGTCHCADCRKSGASPFVIVKRSAFRMTSGDDAVVTRAPQAPHMRSRSFCRQCGTALGEITSASATFPVAANCLDDALHISNGYHEFVREKPTWVGIGDAARQFAESSPA